MSLNGNNGGTIPTDKAVKLLALPYIEFRTNSTVTIGNFGAVGSVTQWLNLYTAQNDGVKFLNLKLEGDVLGEIRPAGVPIFQPPTSPIAVEPSSNYYPVVWALCLIKVTAAQQRQDASTWGTINLRNAIAFGQNQTEEANVFSNNSNLIAYQVGGLCGYLDRKHIVLGFDDGSKTLQLDKNDSIFAAYLALDNYLVPGTNLASNPQNGQVSSTVNAIKAKFAGYLTWQTGAVPAPMNNQAPLDG